VCARGGGPKFPSHVTGGYRNKDRENRTEGERKKIYLKKKKEEETFQFSHERV
jgi:hypothetical protein